ncbi:hypothetical protein BsWGS_12476 [Bradybaena similaris]
MNEAIFQETDENHKLIRAIRRRRSKFFGHVMRRNKFQNMVTTGKFDGDHSDDRESLPPALIDTARDDDECKLKHTEIHSRMKLEKSKVCHIKKILALIITNQCYWSRASSVYRARQQERC